MLARTFLSAKDLKITQEEHDALIKVLDLLERREIPDNLFNMNHIGSIQISEKSGEYCGSAGCILGWAQVFHYGKYLWGTLAGREREGLTELFMFTPQAKLEEMIRFNRLRTKVTPEFAAIGLRNYLTTGSPQWEEILGETK